MRKPYFLLSLLFLTILSCRLGLPENTPPGPEIVISTEEAMNFEHEIKLASDSYSNTGQAKLQITEAEITSYFYFQLQSQNQTIISDPQIYLRDGTIQVFAKYSESKIPVNLFIQLSPLIEAGRLELKLEEIRLGPAAAPSVLVQQAQRIIDEQIEPGLNQNLAGEFNVESFLIADGILIVSGKKP